MDSSGTVSAAPVVSSAGGPELSPDGCVRDAEIETTPESTPHADSVSAAAMRPMTGRRCGRERWANMSAVEVAVHFRSLAMLCRLADAPIRPVCQQRPASTAHGKRFLSWHGYRRPHDDFRTSGPASGRRFGRNATPYSPGSSDPVRTRRLPLDHQPPDRRRVGITTGALYHYTESKAELYAAVYCETIDEVYTEFESAAAEHTDARPVQRRACVGPPRCKPADPSITGFIVAVAQETQRHPDLLELLTAQRGRHTRFFSGLVEAAAERGELGPDVDLTGVADLLGAVMTGLARTAAAAGDSSRYAAAVDVLERVLDGSLVTGS